MVIDRDYGSRDSVIKTLIHTTYGVREAGLPLGSKLIHPSISFTFYFFLPRLPKSVNNSYCDDYLLIL